MKRAIFAAIGAFLLATSLGLSVFAYTLYEDNYRAVEEQNEYHRQRFEERGISYSEAKPGLTVPNIIVIALAALSGLGGFASLILAVVVKGTPAPQARTPRDLPPQPPPTPPAVRMDTAQRRSYGLAIGGGIFLAISLIALCISLVLPLISRAVSWEEAALGIAPALLCGVISLVALVLGLVRK